MMLTKESLEKDLRAARHNLAISVLPALGVELFELAIQGLLCRWVPVSEDEKPDKGEHVTLGWLGQPYTHEGYYDGANFIDISSGYGLKSDPTHWHRHLPPPSKKVACPICSVCGAEMVSFGKMTIAQIGDDPGSAKLYDKWVCPQCEHFIVTKE